MKNLYKICVLMLSLCLTVTGTLAFWSADADEAVQITSPSSGGTSITAQTVVIPTPNFTVSIPTGISLGSIERTENDNEAIASKEFSVGVSGFSNLEGKQVKVTVSTPYNAFNMYCGDHVLPYEVYNPSMGTSPIAVGGEFYTFTTAETVTGNIKVDRYDIPAPGEYGGILTFTFHVEDQPTQS